MKPALLGLALLVAGCAAHEPAPPPAERAPRRDDEPEVSRGPEALGADALPAAPLPDLELRFADGSASSLRAQLGNARALVLAYTSLNCPVSRLYAPGYGALREALAAEGVRLVLVDPMRADDDAEVLEAAGKQAWGVPVARDPDGELTAALDARRTADVFLLDRELRVRYRGAVDDQYGIGYRLAEPRRRYLADAVDALNAGRRIDPPATEAPG